MSFLSLRELKEEACHKLDEVVTFHDELQELNFSVTLESLVPEPAEGDDRVHDELDSLTALLSPLTGAALFSSPQATKFAHTKQAIIERNFFNRRIVLNILFFQKRLPFQQQLFVFLNSVIVKTDGRILAVLEIVFAFVKRECNRYAGHLCDIRIP